MHKKIGSLIFAVIFIMLTVNTAKAEQKSDLPRSFGPLKLGMTIKEFQKITSIEPEVCPHCADNELVAEINIDNFPNRFPEYYYKLPKHKRIVECDFYKNKLYRIILSPEIEKVEIAKEKYNKLFGPSIKSKEFDDMSSLVWEDKTTIFEISYLNKKRAWLKAGTILDIQYIDKYLDKALELQEEKHSTTSHD